jgi:hypothetical protein
LIFSTPGSDGSLYAFNPPGIGCRPHDQPHARYEDLDKLTRKAERTLGVLDGKVTISFADDFKITEEELAGLR